MDPRIKQALELIEVRGCEPLSVDEIATALNLSESRFRCLFKQEVGKNYKSYVRHLRMLNAKQLLEDPDLSIKEVRILVGYSYTSNFIQDFKRWYGVTPSRYRRRVFVNPRPQRPRGADEAF